MTMVELLRKNLEKRLKEQHVVMVKCFEGSDHTFERFLIAVGRFRQLKADIDACRAEIEKRDPEGPQLDEEEAEERTENIPDADEDDESEARKQFKRRRARAWS